MIELWRPAVVWSALAVVAAGVGGLVRFQLRRRRRIADGGITDGDVRRIETEGSLARPDSEPLDPDEIERAEERFWAQPFDEPEPFTDGSSSGSWPD